MIAIAAALIIPAGQSFACTPVRVWDGDGPIWCAEGPRVRLAAIGAREIDGSCRRHQPCPKMSGVAARDVLVRLLGGARGVTPDGHVIVAAPAMRCRSAGSAKGDRTAAWCSLRGVGDLSCALVRAGAAARWRWFGGDRVCRR
ncbi:MAG: hypothetical protein K2Y20_14040 [Sphingomonas sp.]|nr:hypothetical protein [Sphingomonas sp.]